MTVLPQTMMAMCLLVASEMHHVPSAAMLAIMEVEGGAVGTEHLNDNGTRDLGPMQVNTIWVPKMARAWGVDDRTAYRQIRDNACINVHTAAFILRRKIDEADGNLLLGISRYNSANPRFGIPYLRKVLNALLRQQRLTVVK